MAKPTRPAAHAAARWRGQAWRGLALLAICTATLQLYFVARIALMTSVNPKSTSFQRSEIRRLMVDKRPLAWAQEWASDALIADNLKRAVIASEDAGFVDHNGVEWDALEQAWDKNQRASVQAAKKNAALEKTQAKAQAGVKHKATVEPKVVGGSTITQQLAKNLFLSGERTAARKAQEFVITLTLEALLSKRRILEIYLNHVEWGEGLFGAQAASHHYFKADAARLAAPQAARLAVMLPAPKRFEKSPGSAFVSGRAATIMARMPAAELP